jgi:hypothetical protein
MAAVKGAIVLAVLERLMLTRPSHWLEVRARPPTTATHAPILALWACSVSAADVARFRCAGAPRLPFCAGADVQARVAGRRRPSSADVPQHAAPDGVMSEEIRQKTTGARCTVCKVTERARVSLALVHPRTRCRS